MSRMIKQHRVARKRTAGGTQDPTDRDLNVTQPTTDEVRVAAKTANSHKGKFVGIFQTPKNSLELIPNNSSIAEFVGDNADHLGDDILAVLDPKGEKAPKGMPRHNVWGDKELLKELLDDHFSTGWHWLDPKDIHQYTEGIILEAPDGRIYHHPHQLQSAADELLQGKTVKFDGVPENRTPVMADVPEELPLKESSVKSKKAVDDEPILPETNDDPSLPGEPAAIVPPVDVPPAAAVGGANPYSDWKSENLIETIESLTDSESFAQDKPEQKAVEQMAEILSARPVEPVLDQPKKAALKMARLATGKKTADDIYTSGAGVGEPSKEGPCNDYEGHLKPWGKCHNCRHDYSAHEESKGEKEASTVGDLKRSMNKFLDEEAGEKEHKNAGVGPFPPADENTGKILEGDKSIPEGREFQEDNTGVEHPKTDSPQKFAGINDPAENKETATVLEGDKSIPEGKDEEEDNTGITVPATELPEKVASAPITTAKALSLVEDLQEELKALYLDAKPITTANESRPVREAVESIYHAQRALETAQKVLAKQKKQEEDEAAAAAVNAAKGKKSSFLSLSNLKIAAAASEPIKTSSVKERSQFRTRVAAAQPAKLAVEAANELSDAIMRSASAYSIALHASEEEPDEMKKAAFEKKKATLKAKITALASQLGLIAAFEDTGTKNVMLNIASDESIDVPTS